MPEPKAQLVDPQGPIDVPGINATGIITATGGFVGAVQGAATGFAATTYNISAGVVTSTGFVGDVTGTASSVTKGTDLYVGVMTASSFSGDVFGNAAGLSTTTAGLKLGIVTSTTFAGDFTGMGSGITGTPNIQAGIMTATSFAGNFTGLASGITGTPNLMVGILTGTAYSGDGSALTGIAATNWIANNVTANSSTTAIDLALGNVVKFTQTSNTTVSFANTGTSNIVTFIRPGADYTITWPSSIKWNDGSAPPLASKSVDDDVFTLLTRDEGVTWYGWETVTIDKKANRLMLWGRDDDGYGALAQNNPTPNFYSSPVEIFGNGTTWSRLSNGGNHNVRHDFAIKTDGTLWAWGMNQYGQLGLSDKTHRSSPTQVPGTTWAMVQGGRMQTAAVKTDGTLWTWGANQIGALGQNNNTEYSSPKQIPGTTWAVGDGKLSAGGGYNFAAIKTDGTLWAWGYNYYGELGQNESGNPATYSSPRQIPGTTWSTISGTYGGYTAFKTDGTLWVWGYNYRGQLGQNDRTDRSSPVQIPGTTWRSASTGSQCRAATKTDGTLWMWGVNEYVGSLGQNDRTQRSSPVQVPGTDWSDSLITINSNTAVFASKTDGTVWSWGGGVPGTLGHNQNINISSPTQISGYWGDSPKFSAKGDFVTALGSI